MHVYKLRDERGRLLLENGGIFLLELGKFRAEKIETGEQRWLQFFKEGENLDEEALPDWMNTPEMRKAMNVLTQFSEKEMNYHLYQTRQNYLREQRTIQWEYEQDLEQERAAKEQERAAKEEALRREEQERAAKEHALAEVERLRALLTQRGDE